MRIPADHLFPPPEFAETAPLNEAVYLDRPDAFAPPPSPLRLFGCGCGCGHLQRVARSWWMRLLPGFRLYLCMGCLQLVLRPHVRQRHVYSTPDLRLRSQPQGRRMRP